MQDIPEHIFKSLTDYVENGLVTSPFLYAVFCNELYTAVFLASDEEMDSLRSCVRHILNETPIGCHGNIEKVTHWIAKKSKGLTVDQYD